MGSEVRNGAPLVSIIMNSYNGAEFLRDAVESVMAQKYSNWEIVFWDNASTDETSAIAAAYAAADPRFRYFRAPSTTALGAARNLALRQVRGTYIGFLDSDDLYFPDTIERQVRLMESEDYGLVYGRTVTIDETGRVLSRGKIRNRSGQLFGSLLHRYEIAMGSALVRRSVLDAANLGFDESLRFAPDYNMFMKIAATNRIGVIPEAIFKYRRVSTSLTRKSFHLVSHDIGHTLDELEVRNPDITAANRRTMTVARDKLNFYDAVNFVSLGQYSRARSALKPVVGTRWAYRLLYVALFFPIPRGRLLRALNR